MEILLRVLVADLTQRRGVCLSSGQPHKVRVPQLPAEVRSPDPERLKPFLALPRPVEPEFTRMSALVRVHGYSCLHTADDAPHRSATPLQTTNASRVVLCRI